MFKQTSLKALLLFTLLLGWSAAQAEPTVTLDGRAYTLSAGKGDSFTFKPGGKAAAVESVELVFAPKATTQDSLRDVTDAHRAPIQSKGALIKANQMSNEAQEPIGYFLVGYLPEGDALVAQMIRTLLTPDGDAQVGVAVVYEHRFTGEKKQEEMVAWFKAHGRDTENALYAIKQVPPQAELAQLLPEEG